MVQENIDTSASGDTVKDGFDKTEANFTELYAELDTGILIVDSTTVLPNTEAQDALYYAKGKTAAGDGGEGLFRADLADVSTANNGGTVVVRGTLRWKRIYQDTIDARWFGAKADNGVTDNAVALQAAYDACKSGQRWLLPEGRYAVGTALNFWRDQVEVDGRGWLIPYSTYTNWLVDSVGDQSTRPPQPDGGYKKSARVNIRALNMDGLYWSRGARFRDQDNYVHENIVAMRCRGWGILYAKAREATHRNLNIVRGGAHLLQPNNPASAKDAANFGIVDPIADRPDLLDSDYAGLYASTGVSYTTGQFVYAGAIAGADASTKNNFYQALQSNPAPAVAPVASTDTAYWHWIRPGDEPNQLDFYRVNISSSGGRFVEINGSLVTQKQRGHRFFNTQWHYNDEDPYQFPNGRETTLTIAAASGDTVLNVANAQGHIPGQRLEIGGTGSGKIDATKDAVISSVNVGAGTITLTGALGFSAPVGAIIRGWVDIPLEGSSYELVHMDRCEDISFIASNLRLGSLNLGKSLMLGDPTRPTPGGILNKAETIYIDRSCNVSGPTGSTGVHVKDGSSIRVDVMPENSVPFVLEGTGKYDTNLMTAPAIFNSPSSIVSLGAIPNGTQALFNDTRSHRQIDLAGVIAYRLQMNVTTLGTSGWGVRCQYSTDGGTNWNNISTATNNIVVTSTGLKVGTWELLSAGAKTASLNADVLMRVITQNGASGTPSVALLMAEFL